MADRLSRFQIACVASAALSLLAGCGGGDGEGPKEEAGYVAVMGPLAGIGSVYLNGIRYDTSDASVLVDGVAGDVSDLMPGHIIGVEGSLRKGEASAQRVVFIRDLRGTISSVDSDALQFVALGQSVIVGTETSFGDGIEPGSIRGLAVGDPVTVSGLRHADGRIAATRIEVDDGQEPPMVAGPASAVDMAASVLVIEGLSIDFSSANIDGFPSGQPQAGDLVRATGGDLNSAGVLVARSLSRLPDVQVVAEPEGSADIDGVVTRLASASDLSVGGWRILADAGTVYEGGSAGDLSLGGRIHVTGTTDGDGTVTAARIAFRPRDVVRFVSEVTAIDLGSRRVTVLGVTSTTGPGTRFEDRTDAALRTFRLADLHTGDWVDLRGYEDPAAPGSVRCTRLERIDAASVHTLRGPLAAPDEPDFEILGASVTTDPETLFLREGTGQIGPAEFFALPAGTIVEVAGSRDSSVLAAETATEKTLDD